MKQTDKTIFKNMLCPSCKFYAVGIQVCEKSSLPVTDPLKPFRGAVNAQCGNYRSQPPK